MATVALEMKPREKTGKGGARQLRMKGMIPAILYGGGKDPVNLEVEANVIERLLVRGSINAILDLKIAGAEQTLAMIKNIQKETVSSKLVHLDLLRISMDKKVEVSVHLEAINTENLKKNGGIVQVIIGEIPIKCLPDRIPEKLVVDLKDAEVGTTLTAADLPVSEGVEIDLEPDESILTILAPKVEKKIEAAEGVAVEGAEGEAAEGAAAEGEEKGKEKEKDKDKDKKDKDKDKDKKK